MRRHQGASLHLSQPRSLPAHMRGPIVELHSLRTAVSDRGAGHAEALLHEVTGEADMAGVMLLLCVSPGPDTDLERLVAFYERNGFVAIQPEPLLMIRPHAGMAIASGDDRPQRAACDEGMAAG